MTDALTASLLILSLVVSYLCKYCNELSLSVSSYKPLSVSERFSQLNNALMEINSDTKTQCDFLLT